MADELAALETEALAAYPKGASSEYHPWGVLKMNGEVLITVAFQNTADYASPYKP
jgi:hypothetical protein